MVKTLARGVLLEREEDGQRSLRTVGGLIWRQVFAHYGKGFGQQGEIGLDRSAGHAMQQGVQPPSAPPKRGP